jgi:hypothetical protein
MELSPRQEAVSCGATRNFPTSNIYAFIYSSFLIEIKSRNKFRVVLSSDMYCLQSGVRATEQVLQKPGILITSAVTI